MLSAAPAESVTVFLDACFSGTKRESGMLASARGVAIKVRDEVPQGKLVVFTAAQGDETAYQYAEKGHGMFTYFLLKKLQESKGDVTLGELGGEGSWDVYLLPVEEIAGEQRGCDLGRIGGLYHRGGEEGFCGQ